MLIALAVSTAFDDGTDDAAQEITLRVDDAAARQGFSLDVPHSQDCRSSDFSHVAPPPPAASSTMTSVLDPTDPTVLWRCTRGRASAHATLFPGNGQTTLTWFF